MKGIALKNIPRHCERSEAIHSKINRLPRLWLAMTENTTKKLAFVLAVFILLATVGNGLYAQSSFTNQNFWGIKAGVNAATMSYDAKEYSVYKPSYLLGLQLGAFFETSINRDFSFRPEFLIIQRGVFIDNYEGVDYQMSAYYFDLRLPLLYNIRGVSGVIPYFILSPNLCFPYGGEVIRNGLPEKVNADHINDFDFGLSFGAGLKFPINYGNNSRFYLGLEAQYGLGLMNTFSETNYAGNFGSRTNRGIEVALTFSFPLGKSKGAPEKEIVYVDRTDTVHRDRDRERRARRADFVEKDCYEIKEILAYMEDGHNVHNRRICLYDINYDNNRASVDAASRAQLDEIVLLLKNMPNMQMQINGHADNRGTKEVNDKISRERAKGVYDYLVSKGIDKNRLKHEGYGFAKPIATNDTEAGRRQNRRVEFEIIRY